MTKVFCDICGTEIDEDYTRTHYSYNLDFEGHTPHQTFRHDCNGATYGTTLMQTLVYYTDPTSWHLNLCADCGGALGNVIDSFITEYQIKKEVYKPKEEKENVLNGLTQLMRNAVMRDACEKYSEDNAWLMNMEEYKRNHNERPQEN